MASQFYITLPSNTRSDTANTASQFRVPLPHRISLNGEWECALCEIMYPHTWENVTDAQSTLHIIHKLSGDVLDLKIPSGYYSTIKDITEALQWTIRTTLLNVKYPELGDSIIFSYNTYMKRASIKLDSGLISKIILSTHLQNVLGFKEHILTETKYAEYPWDLRGGFDSIYVYCNIVEPQIVGDILAPLLRTVKIEGSHFDIVEKIFNTPHYIPVATKDITDMEIGLKTDTNSYVNFLTGKTVVKLHFRKRRFSEL